MYVVPTPDITISPSGTIQGAMVGSPRVISCTVSTVDGVSPNSITISWTGPSGGSITTNSRVTISSTTSSTSSLEFTYLMEGDEGAYTCNVMILGVNGSNSVNLGQLTSKFFCPTQYTYACMPTRIFEILKFRNQVAQIKLFKNISCQIICLVSLLFVAELVLDFLVIQQL